MYKIAFFVEGKTEMLFVERLLKEFARTNPVLIHMAEVRGGGKNGKVPLTITTVGVAQQPTNEQFYALIYDCGGEDNVKPRINDEHQALHTDGYELIIGIRDVRPKFGIATVPALKTIMKTAIDKNLVPVIFILPLMEVEAWFLSEHTHFPKISPAITTAAISQTLGFDPAVEDMTKRATPADDLNDCYQIGQRVYNKSKVKRTVDALDMRVIRETLINRIPELKKLVKTIDNFLSPPNHGQPQAAPQVDIGNAEPSVKV